MSFCYVVKFFQIIYNLRILQKLLDHLTSYDTYEWEISKC